VRRVEADLSAEINRDAWWARIPALPDATIMELGDHGIRKVSWADLEIVANWRRFLESPEGYLRALL
jgi:hypothetical protein